MWQWAGIWTNPIACISMRHILLFFVVFIQINRTEWRWLCMCNKLQPSERQNIAKFKWLLHLTHIFPSIDKLTPAKNCRSMVKKPFPLIEISRLLIWERSSCLAKCSFSLSPAQNVSFSIFLINSVFWKEEKWSKNVWFLEYSYMKELCLRSVPEQSSSGKH